MMTETARTARPDTLAFSTDAELGYQRSLTDFSEPLTLDESYRLAHLPLVAPEHPHVIPRREGKSYEMGRHPRIFSLVLPVDDAELQASPAFRELETALRASPFARKIAWDVLPRRRDKLHATVCGSLGTDNAPVISPKARQALTAIGPVTVELRGLFSGNVNRGRLYLAVYPERRGETNLLQAIQAAFDRPPGDLWLVGLYNLTDDLDATETAALSALLQRWWNAPLLRFTVRELWLLGADDDLVLDSEIAERLPLRG
ncbi:hypothetical protein ACXIUS_06935 [Bosea thiooxidans]|nr:hypothetical protein [Bosea sp. (in: a-proteobacteria)]